MHLIMKTKPIRGHRKKRLNDLPWITFFKCVSILLIAGIFGFQYISSYYHNEKLSQTQLFNAELTRKVSVLSSELDTERELLESSLSAQSSDLALMKEQINVLNTDLASAKQTNSDLATQVNAFKAQNDVLRNKLETILGTASRSGSELSPNPVGASGLTLPELQALTKGTALSGIEPALLQVEKDYNCNALYTLAVAKLETGLGTSVNCVTKNNLFGMRGNTDWLSYATKSDSVIAFGKLMKSNYFSKGYITLERIGPRYAEGSTTWAPKAKMYMLNDMRKVFK